MNEQKQEESGMWFPIMLLIITAILGWAVYSTHNHDLKMRCIETASALSDARFPEDEVSYKHASSIGPDGACWIHEYRRSRVYGQHVRGYQMFTQGEAEALVQKLRQDAQ